MSFDTQQYKRVMAACKERDKIPTQAWTPDEISYLVEAWYSSHDYYTIPYNLNEVYSWWIKWQVLYVIKDEEHYERIREDEDSALEYEIDYGTIIHEMGNNEQYKRPEKVHQGIMVNGGTYDGDYNWEKLL